MEKNIIKIQSAYRGYRVRKALGKAKTPKSEKNLFSNLQQTHGSLTKNKGFGIIDDFFLEKKKKNKFEIKEKSTILNSIKVQHLPPAFFAASRKPITSIAFTEPKKIKELPRSLKKNCISKSNHIFVKAQKPKSIPSKVSSILLFKNLYAAESKPVVPIQAVSGSKREKLFREINNSKLFTKLEVYQDTKPEPEHKEKASFQNNPKLKTVRPKNLSTNVTKKTESKRKVFSATKRINLETNKESANFEVLNKVESAKTARIGSPYESVWPEKILTSYYNLRLCPDFSTGSKRFKLVKTKVKSAKMSINQKLEDYLRLC